MLEVTGPLEGGRRAPLLPLPPPQPSRGGGGDAFVASRDDHRGSVLAGMSGGRSLPSHCMDLTRIIQQVSSAN